ncbi:hypothetical protein LCGC14_1527100 [marine sediment metagenome]|uniref:Uncharacterized protein n=1 Tax=marine sediment metagenome TaxID=412755 RepID=A0A0F9JHV8_9ZZZZ
METCQLIPFYIFQKLLSSKFYNIESFGESYEVYFQIPNFYKDFEFLRVNFSPNHNVLFEFLNKYYHRWRAKRVPIREIFFEIKAKIALHVRQYRVLNKELLELLLSWVFLRFCLTFFYFSGRCWYNSIDCENFGNPKEKYTFWELMTDPQESVSRYWYIKLFERIFPQLISWISYTSKPSKFRLNLKNKVTEGIFESITNTVINVGTPLLMTKKEIIIMRKFEFFETKKINSRKVEYPWFTNLLEILGKYGYSDLRYNYSTFQKYHNQPLKYPRYHGIIFRKS